MTEAVIGFMLMIAPSLSDIDMENFSRGTGVMFETMDQCVTAMDHFNSQSVRLISPSTMTETIAFAWCQRVDSTEKEA